MPLRVPALALDELLVSAGVDPRHGVQIVDAAHLVSIPFDPGLPLIILRAEPDSAPSTAPAAATDPSAAALSPLPGGTEKEA